MSTPSCSASCGICGAPSRIICRVLALDVGHSSGGCLAITANVGMTYLLGDVVKRGADPRDRRPGRQKQRGAEGSEHLLDRNASHVRDREAGHWKISVVQSPPWSRTSCARAGPSGRSWKSRKKSRSTSMPPAGSQSTLSSHERSSG